VIRIVVDTNILVSALLQPESLPAAVLMLVLSGEAQLCISDAVFAEYDEVIRRPRLKRSPGVIEDALESIRRLSHWTKPSVRVTECTDADDNVFLECAQAGEADYLVAGNKRHFPDRWKKTKVISARELFELLIEQEK
jgi:uncharacterized protein